MVLLLHGLFLVVISSLYLFGGVILEGGHPRFGVDAAAAFVVVVNTNTNTNTNTTRNYKTSLRRRQRTTTSKSSRTILQNNYKNNNSRSKVFRLAVALPART